MTLLDWKKFKWFTPSENWGNPLLMDIELIEKLELMRDIAGSPLRIHCGNQPEKKHVTNSFHYVGQAVDGHFESLSMIDAFLIIEKCFFGGIGLYPQWNQKHGGFHLDTRKVNAGNRWIQYGGLYITLNEKNFKLCEGV